MPIEPGDALGSGLDADEEAADAAAADALVPVRCGSMNGSPKRTGLTVLRFSQSNALPSLAVHHNHDQRMSVQTASVTRESAHTDGEVVAERRSGREIGAVHIATGRMRCVERRTRR